MCGTYVCVDSILALALYIYIGPCLPQEDNTRGEFFLRMDVTKVSGICVPTVHTDNLSTQTICPTHIPLTFVTSMCKQKFPPSIMFLWKARANILSTQTLCPTHTDNIAIDIVLSNES